jgi:hypothetical protein
MTLIGDSVMTQMRESAMTQRATQDLRYLDHLRN